MQVSSIFFFCLPNSQVFRDSNHQVFQFSSPGWATDEIFIYNTSDYARQFCDLPITAWITVGIVLVLCKLSVSFTHAKLWIARTRKMKGLYFQSQRRNPIPFIPILGVCSLCSYFLFFLLTSLNIINATNGWAPALYSCGWLFFALMTLLYRVKMVRLEKKLFKPMVRTKAEVESTTNSRMIDNERKKLTRLALSHWLSFLG